VALNAAAALYVAGMVPDLAEGLAMAQATLSAGRGLERLDRLVHLSHLTEENILQAEAAR
ncbi:MAG: hypothetical protein H7831_12250, partial [Magnetococcus sp. WYHC-3]